MLFRSDLQRRPHCPNGYHSSRHCRCSQFEPLTNHDTIYRMQDSDNDTVFLNGAAATAASLSLFLIFLFVSSIFTNSFADIFNSIATPALYLLSVALAVIAIRRPHKMGRAGKYVCRAIIMMPLVAMALSSIALFISMVFLGRGGPCC